MSSSGRMQALTGIPLSSSRWPVWGLPLSVRSPTSMLLAARLPCAKLSSQGRCSSFQLLHLLEAAAQ